MPLWEEPGEPYCWLRERIIPVVGLNKLSLTHLPIRVWRPPLFPPFLSPGLQHSLQLCCFLLQHTVVFGAQQNDELAYESRTLSAFSPPFQGRCPQSIPPAESLAALWDRKKERSLVLLNHGLTDISGSLTYWLLIPPWLGSSASWGIMFLK